MGRTVTTADLFGEPEQNIVTTSDLFGAETEFPSEYGVIKTFGTGLDEGVKTNALGFIGRKMRLGTATSEEVEWAGQNFRAMGPTTGFSRPSGRVVGQMVDMIKRMVPEATTSGLVLGTAAGVTPQPGTQPVTATAGFMGGFGAMAQASMFRQAFEIESGVSYMELKELNEKHGNKLPDEALGMISDGVGTVAALLELGSFRVLSAPFRRVTRRVMLGGVEKIMTNPTALRAVLKGLKAGGLTYATEVATEALQEVAAIGGEEIAKKQLEGEEYSFDADEAVTRVGHIVSETLRGAWLPSLPGSAINIRADATVGRVERVLKARGATQEQINAVTNGSVSAVELESVLIEEQARKKESVLQAVERAEKGRELTPQMIADIDETVAELAELGLIEVDETVTFGEKLETLKGALKKYEIVETKDSIEELRTEVEILQEADKNTDLEAKKSDLVDVVQKTKMHHTERADAVKRIMAAEDIATLQREMQGIFKVAEQARNERVVQQAAKKITKTLRIATKKKKKGTRKTAKYLYKDNKMMAELRRIDKLTKEQADKEFSELGDPTNNFERIKKSFLSMKVLEGNTTPELANQVLADIQAMKTLAKETADETEFEKRMERVEMQETVVDRGMALKKKKKGIKTAIANMYRRGVADNYSLLNSMFGTEIAEYYDLAQYEQNRRVAVQKKRRLIDKAMERIYGEKNIARVMRRLVKDKNYTLTKTGSKVGKTLNKLQLIDIWNSIKNEHSRNQYYRAYGEKQEDGTYKSEQIDNLMAQLDPSDKAFGDFLQEQVQEYREVLNKKNIEDTGTDLGFIENYWPRRSETVQEIMAHFRMLSNVPSAMKERATQGKVTPVPQDAYLAALRHIEEAEWIDKVSRKYEESKRDFNSGDVKDFINEYYGDKVLGTLNRQLERNSMKTMHKQVEFGFNIFNFLINNWVVANVAFNPSVIARQIGSMTNYSQHMNKARWAWETTKALKNSKQTFDYMWKNSEYLRERWKMGYSDALERANRDAYNIAQWWGNFNAFLTSGSRATDIGAQIYGGYALVKEFEKTMTTEEAFKKFEQISRREQQSGLEANLSNVQSWPGARWMFAFKNTPMQYTRLMADAILKFQHGEITKSQLTNVLLQIGIIQPVMYSLTGGLTIAAFKAAGGEDPEDLMKELAVDTGINLMTASTNFIPLVEGATKMAAREWLDQETYKPLNIPVIDDFNIVLSKAKKEEKTLEDWIIMSHMIQEAVFPMPTGTAKRYYDYITGDKKVKPY